MSLILTHKDLLELKYWLTCDMAGERAMLLRYLQIFGYQGTRAASVLEIGTGAHWGLLPLLDAHLKTGIDPLYPAFEATGVLADRGDIRRVDECFERWDTNDTFDAILTTNALDHGEMGFYLLPKMARLLKPGGRLYIHVHLRPADLLNLIHDHSLTEPQLDKHLGYTDLIEERREFHERDVDGNFCRALVGVWRRPQ